MKLPQYHFPGTSVLTRQLSIIPTFPRKLVSKFTFNLIGLFITIILFH